MIEVEVNKVLFVEFYKIILVFKMVMFDELVVECICYFIVIFENIYQEYNVSVVMCFCESFGIQELYVIEFGNEYKLQCDIVCGVGCWIELYNYNQQQLEVDCF